MFRLGSKIMLSHEYDLIHIFLDEMVADVEHAEGEVDTAHLALRVDTTF